VTNEQAFIRLIEECDIYFEDSIISKERIVQKYAEFFASSFGTQAHSIAVAQHTGSICFDVISFLIAALGCIALNESQSEDIVRSFNNGQMVILTSGTKKERWLWCGFMRNISNEGLRLEVSDFENADYAMLEQPSSHSKYYLPRNRWNQISPYNGTSTRADGRGIRKVKTNRNEFISYLFDIPALSVPSIVDVSTVIVSDREMFKRIAEGIRIEYDEGKCINLLDLVTASYYTSNLEEHQYGTNPAKIEPNLKITSRISAARDLVLDKSGNKTVGFMIVGSDSIASGNAELSTLIERKSLKYVFVSATVDSEAVQNIIDTQEDASIFVCTKEFLLQHSLPVQSENPLTIELDMQIENIVNNEVSSLLIEGGCSWQDFKKIKEALNAIKQSDIKSGEKDAFLITAHALLNLIITSVFPLEKLNQAMESGSLISKATAPSAKIAELWNLADKTTDMLDMYLIVADTIDGIYQLQLTDCPKCAALLNLLKSYPNNKIAIVVPKAYYADILKSYDVFANENITITTANRFNGSAQYDVVIVAGDFSGTRFNPLKCRSATDIFVMLYESEMRFFKYKKRKADAYERSINSRLLISTDDLPDNEEDPDEIVVNDEDIQSIITAESDFNSYIDTITAFDIGSFASRLSSYSDNAPTTEVYAAGHFLSGEQILFTRNYQAVVFDEDNETVIETDVETLRPGDIVIFAKRDDYTKNMVDYIYDQLQLMGKFSPQILDATEKTQYWKLALREYKENNDLSYRDLAKSLQSLGLSIQEVSVRQWLIEESHIVGPREENTLLQIANLTQDPFLLKDTSAYFKACEIVRRQRKSILKLIGRAIVDKLSGHVPQEDELLDFIYGNVEKLSETLELESISILDKSIPVPVNFTNRPINNTEVTL